MTGTLEPRAPELGAHRRRRRTIWQTLRARFAEAVAEAHEAGHEGAVARAMGARAVRGDMRALISELLVCAPVPAVIEFLMRGGLEWGSAGERILEHDDAVIGLIECASPRPIWADLEVLDRGAAADDARWSSWVLGWIQALRAASPIARGLLGQQPPASANSTARSGRARRRKGAGESEFHGGWRGDHKGVSARKPTRQRYDDPSVGGKEEDMRMFDGVETNAAPQQSPSSAPKWLSLLLLALNAYIAAEQCRQERIATQARQPTTLEQVMAQAGLKIPSLEQSLAQLMGDGEEAKSVASMIANAPDPVNLLEQLARRVSADATVNTAPPASVSNEPPRAHGEGEGSLRPGPSPRPGHAAPSTGALPWERPGFGDITRGVVRAADAASSEVSNLSGNAVMDRGRDTQADRWPGRPSGSRLGRPSGSAVRPPAMTAPAA